MRRRASHPVTVALTGAQRAFVEERVRNGRFASVSEVVGAGSRVLEREEAHLDAWMREKVLEALADPRPPIAAYDVFSELRALHARRGGDT